MAKKAKKHRGRPTKFVKDEKGGIVYGLSALTVKKNGKTRLRYYATFSKPRKWFGFKWPAAHFRFGYWLEEMGYVHAWNAKTGQTAICLSLHPKVAEELPDWLKGKKSRKRRDSPKKPTTQTRSARDNAPKPTNQETESIQKPCVVKASSAWTDVTFKINKEDDLSEMGDSN